MADIAIVRECIQKADEDFEFALVNLKERKPFIGHICFHFQQSAEKYLKAYVVARELEFRKTHDLAALLKICVSSSPSFEQLDQDCEYLNTFYVETRYPVHWPTNFSENEAQRSCQAAENIKDVVKNELGIANR